MQEGWALPVSKPFPTFLPDCDCNAGGTQGNACRKDPRLGRCVCKPNFRGAHCELCAPGFYGPSCHCECDPSSTREVPLHQVSSDRSVVFLFAACQCSSPGVANGLCDPESGQCTCRTGFEGDRCDHCALGYFHFPLCQREWHPSMWAQVAGVPEGQPIPIRIPVTHSTLQYVAAAQQGPCLKVVTRLAVASADLALMVLTVTAAFQATMGTLTVTVSRELEQEGVKPSPQDQHLTLNPCLCFHSLCL